MVNGALSTADLLELTGFVSASALRRCLDEQKVPYFLGKDGAPWTTLPLLTAAKLGLQANDAGDFSPETL